MFFFYYRARKREEKKRQKFITRIYPPGCSTEPKRQPNPDYKLQTPKETLVQCLRVHDHLSEDDAEYQATNILAWIPQSLMENLDEAVQRKPLSNIIVDTRLTLWECMGFFYHDKTLSSVYFAIYYLAAEAAGRLQTPQEIIAEYKQALIER